MGKEFSEHWERFGAVEGKAVGSLPETGVTLTVIGCVRGRCPQVTMNRLDSSPWEVLDISAFGHLKGVGDKDLFLMNWWKGA